MKLVLVQQRKEDTEYFKQFSELKQPNRLIRRAQAKAYAKQRIQMWKNRRPGEHMGMLSANVIRKNGIVENIALDIPNLLSQDGRDFYHAQCLVESAANTTKGANQIAVTESTITPAATDTTLTGEITVNGLDRSDPSATITHTDNSNSTTIEHTFTAGGSFTDVKASALFNAATSGIMTHIANFSTGSGTLQSGDTLKVTWTINIG